MSSSDNQEGKVSGVLRKPLNPISLGMHGGFGSLCERRFLNSSAVSMLAKSFSASPGSCSRIQ
jgi:hypothetical protein